MKIINLLLFCFALILTSSCNPKISTSLDKSYKPLPFNQNVIVYGINQLEPDGAEVLGQVEVGDTGFSINCGYETVIEKAKIEAKKVGGNAIKITVHVPPSVLGTACHQIIAKILNVENIKENMPFENVDSTLLNADYALLHAYRDGKSVISVGTVNLLLVYNLCKYPLLFHLCSQPSFNLSKTLIYSNGLQVGVQ